MLSAKRWSCYPENGVLDACVKHMFFPNIGVSVVRFGAPLASSPRAKGKTTLLGGRRVDIPYSGLGLEGF